MPTLEAKQALTKAAAKVSVATPKTYGGLTTLFVSVILPILPALIEAAAGKIKKSSKLMRVIETVIPMLEQIRDGKEEA